MADSPRRTTKKSNTTTPEVAIVEGILKGLGAILGLFFEAFRTGSSTSSKGKVSRAQIQEGWERVELHVLNEATAPLAVSEGDKLVDAALQSAGVKGTNMGERLKNAQDLFPEHLYQALWNAHKLRNTSAHEVGAQVSPAAAREAVSTFRSALYHLKAL